MKKLLIAGAVLIVVVACNKDKFQTSPQIQLQSISTRVVPVNGTLDITLSYTDKEGDISDTLFFAKQRLNKIVKATLRDTIVYPIPEFPNYDKGEIGLNLRYSDHLISAVDPPAVPGSNPTTYQPDTLNIKIWIHDKALHVSDTVSTGQVVILR